jgi:hypothetical protein
MLRICAGLCARPAVGRCAPGGPIRGEFGGGYGASPGESRPGRAAHGGVKVTRTPEWVVHSNLAVAGGEVVEPKTEYERARKIVDSWVRGQRGG